MESKYIIFIIINTIEKVQENTLECLFIEYPHADGKTGTFNNQLYGKKVEI